MYQLKKPFEILGNLEQDNDSVAIIVTAIVGGSFIVGIATITFLYYAKKRRQQNDRQYSKRNNKIPVEMADLSPDSTQDIPSLEIKFGKLIGRGAFGAVKYCNVSPS
jgi:hypothetical protein